MGTEKANGTKVPDYITQMSVKEDRAIAMGMAAMMKNQQEGKFSSLERRIPQINLGTIMIFGTGGEVQVPNMEKLFNKPEGYNLLED